VGCGDKRPRASPLTGAWLLPEWGACDLVGVRSGPQTGSWRAMGCPLTIALAFDAPGGRFVVRPLRRGLPARQRGGVDLASHVIREDARGASDQRSVNGRRQREVLSRRLARRPPGGGNGLDASEGRLLLCAVGCGAARFGRRPSFIIGQVTNVEETQPRTDVGHGPASSPRSTATPPARRNRRDPRRRLLHEIQPHRTPLAS